MEKTIFRGCIWFDQNSIDADNILPGEGVSAHRWPRIRSVSSAGRILAWPVVTRDIYRSQGKALRHSSVERSIPHVISRVPARERRVKLSPGYHICVLTRSSLATQSVRPLSPPVCSSFFRSPPLRPSHPVSRLASPLRSPLNRILLALSLSLNRRTICLWFKTSGHLLHCLLTRPLTPTHTRTYMRVRGASARTRTYVAIARNLETVLHLSRYYGARFIESRDTGWFPRRDTKQIVMCRNSYCWIGIGILSFPIGIHFEVDWLCGCKVHNKCMTEMWIELSVDFS